MRTASALLLLTATLAPAASMLVLPGAASAHAPSPRTCDAARRRGDVLRGCPQPQPQRPVAREQTQPPPRPDRPIPRLAGPANPTLPPGAVAMRNALATQSEREWLETDAPFLAIELRIRALGTLADLRALAQSGNRRAQYLIGRTYDFGQFGAPRDRTQAVQWYRRAAELRDARGQSELGVAYERGDGIGRNDTEAARLYRLAAAQGHGWGLANLGYFLREGRGGQRNYTLAMTMLRRAADQDINAAFVNIGTMYGGGEGVRQDYAQALQWYRAGASRGHHAGQANLGAYLYEGRPGVPQDRAEGLMWLRRAVANGSDWARSFMISHNIPL